MLSASLNKTFPSFLPSFAQEYTHHETTLKFSLFVCLFSADSAPTDVSPRFDWRLCVSVLLKVRSDRVAEHPAGLLAVRHRLRRPFRLPQLRRRLQVWPHYRHKDVGSRSMDIAGTGFVFHILRNPDPRILHSHYYCDAVCV